MTINNNTDEIQKGTEEHPVAQVLDTLGANIDKKTLNSIVTTEQAKKIESGGLGNAEDIANYINDTLGDSVGKDKEKQELATKVVSSLAQKADEGYLKQPNEDLFKTTEQEIVAAQEDGKEQTNEKEADVKIKNSSANRSMTGDEDVDIAEEPAKKTKKEKKDAAEENSPIITQKEEEKAKDLHGDHDTKEKSDKQNQKFPEPQIIKVPGKTPMVAITIQHEPGAPIQDQLAAALESAGYDHKQAAEIAGQVQNVLNEVQKTTQQNAEQHAMQNEKATAKDTNIAPTPTQPEQAIGNVQEKVTEKTNNTKKENDIEDKTPEPKKEEKKEEKIEEKTTDKEKTAKSLDKKQVSPEKETEKIEKIAKNNIEMQELMQLAASTGIVAADNTDKDASPTVASANKKTKESRQR